MATLIPTVMTAIKGFGVANALMAGGTILSGAAAIQQGNTARATSNYEAQQLEAQGKAEMAASQREADNESRQNALVMSRARAAGAASGGGIDYDLMGDIGGEGEYRALTALWQGGEAAKGRNQQAANARLEGKQQQRAGRVNAFNTLLQGGTSLYEKYS